MTALDRLLREATQYVPCGKCGVPPGTFCVYNSTRYPHRFTHWERLEHYDGLERAGALEDYKEFFGAENSRLIE